MTHDEAEIDWIAEADNALRAWGAARMPVPVGAAPARPGGARRGWPTAIAAAIVGGVLGSIGGYAFADRTAPVSPVQVAAPLADGRSTFVVLLEEGATWPPREPLMRQGYVAWRDSLEARGQFIGGERLTQDEGRYLDTTRAEVPPARRMVRAPNYSGYFLIRARDYDEAVAIASGSPHLNYGGVLIRRAH